MGLSHISMDTYRELTEPKQTLWEVFQKSPLADVELKEMPREPEEMRDINLPKISKNCYTLSQGVALCRRHKP